MLLRRCSNAIGSKLVNVSRAFGAQGKERKAATRRQASAREKLFPNCPTHLHVIDQETVKLIVNSLKENGEFNSKSIVFEASPGPGRITEALLAAGVSRLRVFVSNKESDYENSLKQLEQQYPLNLEIFYEDLIDINGIIHNDYEKGTNKLINLFADIDVVKWNENSTLKIIIPLSPINECKFLRSLFTHFAHLSGIYATGPTEIITTISGYEHWYMTGKPEPKQFDRYRHITVLYNTFFDINYIAKIPWSNFLPEVKIGKGKSAESKRKKFDVDNAYLIKLTPKKDLPNKIDTKIWPDYLFFVQQVMTKRKSFVIPIFEKWIPDCGPRLIKHGIGQFKRFGDLHPGEMLNLFAYFSEWPEYNYSNFKQATTSLRSTLNEWPEIVKSENFFVNDDDLEIKDIH